MCSWLMEELDEWGLLDEPRTKEVRRKVQHLIHRHLEDDDATPHIGGKFPLEIYVKIFTQNWKKETHICHIFPSAGDSCPRQASGVVDYGQTSQTSE